MFGKLPSLKRRLARIEKVVASRAREQELQECTCGAGVMVWTGQVGQLKADLERTCPAHGFRRVRIMLMRVMPPRNGSESEKERNRLENAELDQVIQDYKTRESAWVLANPDCLSLHELARRYFKKRRRNDFRK